MNVIEMTPLKAGLLAVALMAFACETPSTGGPAGSDSAATAAPSASAAATGSAAAAATAPSSAKAPAAADLSVLGGKDWKAVFAGPAPMELTKMLGGGQGTGMADDHAYSMGMPDPHWKRGSTSKGSIFWASSKKAVAVTNLNLKLDATQKSVDLWIKSALVKAVKHTADPEIIEVGPTKALAKAGAGTCQLKGGEEADFYWRDVYTVGSFSHVLLIVVVAKDASDEDKKVALSAIRQLEYFPKAKLHYKK